MFSWLKRASLFDGFQEPLKRIHFAIGLQMWTYLVHPMGRCHRYRIAREHVVRLQPRRVSSSCCEFCSDPECVDPNCEGSVKPQDAEDLKLLIQVGG